MKRSTTFVFALLAVLGLAASTASAGEIDPALKAKLDAQVKIVQSWVNDPVIVQAVKAQNASPSAEAKAMTEAKWGCVAPVRRFRPVAGQQPGWAVPEGQERPGDQRGLRLGGRRNEGGLPGEDHQLDPQGQGQARRADEREDLVWRGQTDKSTGLQQIQVCVPVLDGGQPIGAVVVGFQVSRLGQ